MFVFHSDADRIGIQHWGTLGFCVCVCVHNCMENAIGAMQNVFNVVSSESALFSLSHHWTLLCTGSFLRLGMCRLNVFEE